MISDKGQKQKAQKMTRQMNVLEGLKDIGNSTAQSLKEDLFEKGTEDLFGQLFGRVPKKYSGEITPGEPLEFNEVFSGKREEKVKLNKQMALERQLSQEESSRKDKKVSELKVQLQALMQEVLSLAKTTQNLGENVQIAAMQAPVEPGVYHIIFFEKLLEFIKSFRKKIESAGVWLNATNKRAEKKNYWTTYKKKGSSFLLSPDHYLQRSAG